MKAKIFLQTALLLILSQSETVFADDKDVSSQVQVLRCKIEDQQQSRSSVETLSLEPVVEAGQGIASTWRLQTSRPMPRAGLTVSIDESPRIPLGVAKKVIQISCADCSDKLVVEVENSAIAKTPINFHQKNCWIESANREVVASEISHDALLRLGNLNTSRNPSALSRQFAGPLAEVGPHGDHRYEYLLPSAKKQGGSSAPIGEGPFSRPGTSPSNSTH